MAVTKRGAELTDEKRLHQVSVTHALQRLIEAIFLAIFDYGDIKRSAPIFAEAVADEILEARKGLVAKEIEYLREFQRAEKGYLTGADHEVFESLRDHVTREDVVRSIASAYLSSAYQSSRDGLNAKAAAKKVSRAVTGDAGTLAQDGARGVAMRYVTAKGIGAIGYARVVDADPCPFCAMLAARGVVNGALRGNLYRSDSFKLSSASKASKPGKRSGFEVHDFCCCTLEPVYKTETGYKMPGNAQKLAEEWAEVAAGYRGDDAFRAWSRWRTSGTLPEDYDGPLQGTRRRSKPVTGQAEGTRDVPVRRKKKPEAPSEQLYREHLARYRQRVEGIKRELADRRAAGQPEDDFSLRRLKVALADAEKLVAQYERFIKRNYSTK